jgi:hypothetical protein
MVHTPAGMTALAVPAALSPTQGHPDAASGRDEPTRPKPESLSRATAVLWSSQPQPSRSDAGVDLVSAATPPLARLLRVSSVSRGADRQAATLLIHWAMSRMAG